MFLKIEKHMSRHNYCIAINMTTLNVDIATSVNGFCVAALFHAKQIEKNIRVLVIKIQFTNNNDPIISVGQVKRSHFCPDFYDPCCFVNINSLWSTHHLNIQNHVKTSHKELSSLINEVQKMSPGAKSFLIYYKKKWGHNTINVCTDSGGSIKKSRIFKEVKIKN